MIALRRTLPLLLAFAFFAVGCDSTEDTTGEEFPLTGTDNASFTFDLGTLTSGSVTSDPETESSIDIINDDRFGPDDIVSARIDAGSVELSLDFPGGADQEIQVGSATLRLRADGVGEQVVARGSDFSLVINTTNAQSRRTVLDVTNADITDFLQQESFTATLTLDVDEAGTGAYQFTVTFDVDATVNAVAPPAPTASL